MAINLNNKKIKRTKKETKNDERNMELFSVTVCCLQIEKLWCVFLRCAQVAVIALNLDPRTCMYMYNIRKFMNKSAKYTIKTEYFKYFHIIIVFFRLLLFCAKTDYEFCVSTSICFAAFPFFFFCLDIFLNNNNQ